MAAGRPSWTMWTSVAFAGIGAVHANRLARPGHDLILVGFAVPGGLFSTIVDQSSLLPGAEIEEPFTRDIVLH